MVLTSTIRWIMFRPIKNTNGLTSGVCRRNFFSLEKRSLLCSTSRHILIGTQIENSVIKNTSLSMSTSDVLPSWGISKRKPDIVQSPVENHANPRTHPQHILGVAESHLRRTKRRKPTSILRCISSKTVFKGSAMLSTCCQGIMILCLG